MTLQLTRIKTYAWHNLLHQDIDLKGGDVFCIGASETGKTTVLDSLQLLLTGDVDTQWNTAANPAISKTALKEGGRNLHDLLVRKQDDGSRLRPDGLSIGYFAAELTDDATGTVISLAIGARTLGHHSPHVEKWWLCAPGTSLKDVRFTAMADGQTHVLDKDDFRIANGDYVYDTHRYRMRLAKELFPILGDAGSEEVLAHLERWASYLNVGKSYGRLKEQSIDPLIQESLPAPRLEAFEEAKQGLSEIQRIRTQMDEARRNLETLQAILVDLKEARRNHLTLRILDYATHYRQHSAIKSDIARLQHRAKEQAGHAEHARVTLLRLDSQEVGLKQRLAAILDPSKVSLINQQETLRTRLKEAAERCRGIEERQKVVEKEARRVETELKRLTAEYAEARRQTKARILTVAANAPADLAPAIQQFADSLESGNETDIELTRNRLTRDASEAREALAVKAAEHRRLATEATQQAVQLRKEREALADQKALPPVPILPEVTAIVGDLAQPLYLGIEVRAGQESTATLLQEFLGPGVLSALVPRSPEHVPRLRTAVHARHPNILVVDTSDLPNASVLAGPLACIDLATSNPDAVRFLAKEYGDVALLEPGQDRDDHARAIWRDGTVFEGRTWHIETGRELKFLGQQARERARSDRIASLDGQIGDLVKQERANAARVVALSKQQETIAKAVSDALDAHQTGALVQRRTNVQLMEQTKAPLEAQLVEYEKQLGDETIRREEIQRAYQAVQEDVAKAGADKMVQERDAIQGQLDNLRLQRDEALRSETQAKTLSDAALSSARAKEADLRAAHVRVTEARQVILALRPMTSEEFESTVKEDGALEAEDNSNMMRRTSVSGNFGKRVQSVKLAVLALPQSENMTFDEDRLVVQTTSGRMTLEERIKQLADATKTQREQQQRRIAQIYTDQVINPIGPMLKQDLDQMEQLIDGINRELKGIPFNGRKYLLAKSRSSDTAPELVRLIQEFTPTNALPLQEFLQRKFLDEDTKVEELQRLFDYRRWYAFTLRRSRAGKDDEYADASSLSSSGGAQAAPHYILVYAMLRLLYETTKSRIRVILLDEAFRGVDAGNKPVLYEMGKQLGLTLVVANTEFEGHSTLRTTADVLTLTKNQHSETFIEKWSQRKHAPELAR